MSLVNVRLGLPRTRGTDGAPAKGSTYPIDRHYKPELRKSYLLMRKTMMQKLVQAFQICRMGLRQQAHSQAPKNISAISQLCAFH